MCVKEREIPREREGRTAREQERDRDAWRETDERL
jgi:hypothetical protein